MISGFLREEDVNSLLLGYYVASSGNFLQMFRDNAPKCRYEITTTLCVTTQKNTHLKFFFMFN